MAVPRAVSSIGAWETVLPQHDNKAEIDTAPRTRYSHTAVVHEGEIIVSSRTLRVKPSIDYSPVFGKRLTNSDSQFAYMTHILHR